MAREARALGADRLNRIVISPHVRTAIAGSGVFSDLASFQMISTKVGSLTVDFRLG